MRAFMELEARLNQKSAQIQSEGKNKKEEKKIVEEKPVEPEPYECCGNGCADCVWVDYWQRLEQWKKQQEDKPL